MAICAFLAPTGELIQQAHIPLNECTGFVILDKADWVQYGLIQSLITIPNSADAQTAWMAGFVTPMAVGLVAWACAALVNFWKD